MEPTLLATDSPQELTKQTPEVQTTGLLSSVSSPIKSAVGLYQFSPQAVSQPTTEADIVQTIQWANEQGLRVRAIGALHSAVPLPATGGRCIALEQYNQVLKTEGTLVTVQSGLRLRELNDFLAGQGLALPTLGTIAQQSVAGAISTGTHGGSIHCKSLSGYVQAMRIVQANGNVIEVNCTDALFDALAISLGTLGILSTVTFQCVPAFSLKTKVVSMPATALIENFNTIHRQNQFVDIRYSPITDRAHAALMNASKSPTDNISGHSEPPKNPKPLTNDIRWQAPQAKPQLQSLVDNINKLGQRLFSTHKFNWIQRQAIEHYDKNIYRTVCGRSDFVLTHFDVTSTDLIANESRNDLDPVADMEVAIAYSCAGEALTALRNYFQSTQKFPSMHIHLRAQAAESFWLSPTHGEPICWIEFWEYPCTGKFFQTMIEILHPFNPRGHWGKQLPTSPTKQYNQWQNFTNIRQQWDPKGLFSNTYLDKLQAGHI